MSKESLTQKKAAYDAKVEKNLAKQPERKNLTANRVYTPLDVEALDYERDLGFPGEYPFTRGVQPTMHRGRFWTMRQYAGFGTAEQSNERFRYLLDQGQTGLSVAFDLPTQTGYDSDDPIAEGEVGKVGVAIDTLADMEVLLKDIPLDKVSTSMTINSPAGVLLAMYIVVAEKQGVTAEKLNGTIQNDILKEYTARGTYIFPPKPSMRLVTDIFSYCAANVPAWNTISISGYHIREAGSSAVDELAFTLADGIAYIEAAVKADLQVDDFAGRLSFFWSAGNHLLEEIAKYRAARRMWAEIMKDRFAAKSPRSMMMRFHAQTAGSTLTAQQAENNIVRVTIQTLAAVLGGAQSLHTNSKDEAMALPSEDSVRTALRTQQIVAYESGVADTIDALAGSYTIEAMTNQMEKQAWEQIKKIDEMGGAVAAIEAGYMQKAIQESAYKQQKAVELKETIIVGVNQFQIKEKPVKGLLKVDPSVGKKQKQKLAEIKAGRDGATVARTLADLKKTCSNESAPVMPSVLECVRGYATLGEICGVMKSVFGEYKGDTLI